MYSIHTTPGLIIESRTYGEAGKILSIFTRDFGLIRTVAQGIRLEKSKLRYHVREYEFGIFSVVRGREYWRLTSAQEAQGMKNEAGRMKQEDHIKSQELFVRISLLLRRLLHGEESHPELFEVLQVATEYMSSKGNEMSKDLFQSFETLLVARILNRLGYFPNHQSFQVMLESNDFLDEFLVISTEQRTVLNGHINRALKESQL